MSDTEIPIMPAPDKVHFSANSLMRYRHAFTALHVFKLADAGRRLEVNDDGRIICFDLDRDQSAALAELLTGDGQSRFPLMVPRAAEAT